MSALIRPRRLRLGLGAGLLLACAVLAIGWLHTAAGLRLLVALGVPCPVNTVSAQRVAELRRTGLAPLSKLAPAPARPALAGMQLDRTTEAEARAFLARVHARCEQQVRGYRYLRCRGVDAQALALAGPPVSELWLSFGQDGRLVGIDVYRRGMAPRDLRTVWSADAARLRDRLGRPTLALGDPAPEALAASPLRVARVQYRYADYVATITAAHLPQTGLSVREQYMSARI